MPLCESTALFLQKAQLTLCFHAHGDDGKLQISRSLQDQIDKARGLFILLHLGDRASVQLQTVDGDGRQHAERAVFRAEIVYPDLLARSSQIFHNVKDLELVFRAHGLSDFEFQIAV